MLSRVAVGILSLSVSTVFGSVTYSHMLLSTDNVRTTNPLGWAFSFEERAVSHMLYKIAACAVEIGGMPDLEQVTECQV